MKHLLNDMTEKEKNSIREQHTGGIKVMTENFSKLVNSKLGDSKPFINEQHQPSNFSSGQVVKAKRDKDGQVYTIKIVKSEPRYMFGVVMGPGTYQGESMKNGLSLELYSYSPDKISGNMDLGEFTVIK